MKNLSDLEANIQKRLEEIKPVPPRDPRVAARARARFLTQAAAANEAQRRKGWGFIFGFRQKQFAMNMAVAFLVIAGLFVGGGTTVQAAQDDLPNEPLYIVKTWSEDVSLQFASSPEAKTERLMELAQTRVQEMAQLIETGQTPPEKVELRLERHLQQAFQLSSNMEDAALDETLVQLHDQLQEQHQNVQQLQTLAAENAQPVLKRTDALLETHLQVVDEGLRDPQVFRAAVNNELHYGQTETPTAAASATPPAVEEQPTDPAIATPQPENPGNGNGIGPNGNGTPGGPNADVTPGPNGNGQGPGNNNGGGNDKDKGKDKDPKDEDSNKGGNGKDPKNPK